MTGKSHAREAQGGEHGGEVEGTGCERGQEKAAAFGDAEALLRFIEGEERTTVLRHADARLRELGHKGKAALL